jgi:hypothetical protein
MKKDGKVEVWWEGEETYGAENNGEEYWGF